MPKPETRWGNGDELVTLLEGRAWRAAAEGAEVDLGLGLAF